MATSSPCADAQASAASHAVAYPVLQYLRLEGLAVAAVTALLYARTGASWWLFAALWLVPDLSMLGYLAGSCWGARTYNAVHSYVAPLTLALLALVLGQFVLLPFALIWVNHISIDRLMGYGLKYPAGFGWTHLGVLGKRDKLTPPLQPPA
jgi:hypothetical protein